LATEKTVVTRTYTAKELLEKLGFRYDELLSFSVPAKGQSPKSVDDKLELVLKIVVREKRRKNG